MSKPAFRILTGVWILSVFACIATLFWSVCEGVRHAHTGFLFSQLATAYERHLASGNKPVESEQAFLTLIPQWKTDIDWNSCRIENGVIFDSWKTPIRIRVESSNVNLRAAGRDHQFQTDDDITLQTRQLITDHPSPPASWR